MAISTTARLRATLGALALGAAFALPAAHAGNLEPAGINTGGTSFFDGFGATKPGLAYLGYYQYQHYDRIDDNNGNESPGFKSPNIDVFLMLNQLAYTTDKTFFGGDAHLGFTGLLPILHFNTSFGSGSPATLDSQDGVGDLTLGAYLQFNPVIQGGRPVYSQRVEFDVIVPTGQYSSNTDINPGSGFWSINPYWAATWLPTPKTEISWRLHYLYNFSNKNPRDPAHLGLASAKAGQAMWVNFTGSYALNPELHVGLNGYYFQQLSNDSYEWKAGSTPVDMPYGDTGKAEVLAIGPGLFWKADERNMWFVNLYDQVQAKNHVRGTVLNVHWVHPF